MIVHINYKDLSVIWYYIKTVLITVDLDWGPKIYSMSLKRDYNVQNII